MTYAVTLDCRITIRLTSGIRPPDDREVEIRGALAYGGEEVLGTVVLPQPSKAGIVMKSVEPRSGELIAGVKDLLDRVARRMGILP